MEQEAPVKVCPVRVALRVRPLIPKEVGEGSQQCLEVVKGQPQVVVKGNRSFTYDYAFGPETSQKETYQQSIADVVQNLFKGYNVTVFAYGQTSSGKTFSMGTCYDSADTEETKGIIPRALDDIFAGIQARPDWDFELKVSFMELYNEQLYDLLAPNRAVVDLREDPTFGVKVAGLTEMVVCSVADTMRSLELGSQGRSTGATAMNHKSSRSHAIFTMTIEQWQREDSSNVTSAKFHLVDLAGSERLKKTKAEGSRLKEGVNINMGLMTLGKVIKALCDGESHIPYRESRLTRLLQDSLGGNSHTIMMACVSPADVNLDETMSTLRYADRARRIKNKPIVNRDPQAAEIARLKEEVRRLAAMSGSGGDIIEEVHRLRTENHRLAAALQDALDKSAAMVNQLAQSGSAQERMRLQINDLQRRAKCMVDLNQTYDCSDGSTKLLKELESRLSQAAEASKNKLPELEEDKEEGEMKDDDEEEEEEDEANLVLKQAEMNRELERLNRDLLDREALMVQVAQSAGMMGDQEGRAAEEVRRLEDEVERLCKEKEELQNALRNARTSAISSKLAEDRRKRVQELEKQIGDLKKKITEQGKMLKVKEKTEEKVKRLTSEIDAMKHKKVELMRRMREDSERFRRLQLKQDREVVQLRQRERRQECQLLRMAQAHTKRQNVLQRKVEEVNAINRRLKESLQIQRAARESRSKSSSNKAASSKGEDRIGSWISQELQVAINRHDARFTLQELMDDRASLSGKATWAREMARVTKDREEADQHEKDAAQCEGEVASISQQIAQLQEKLLESDTESTKEWSRWDSINTVSEAKYGLKYLFRQVAAIKTEATVQGKQLESVKNYSTSLLEEIEKLKRNKQELQAAHRQELNTLEREHEEKVLTLLGQFNTTASEAADTDNSSQLGGEDSVLKRVRFQEEELVRSRRAQESLREELEQLRRELATRKAEAAAKTLVIKTAKGAKSAQADRHHTPMTPETPDGATSQGEDDPEKDPDWTKTPIYRRYKKTKARSILEEKNTTKRDSDGNIRCACKGQCSRRTCGCRKAAKSCDENCRCKKSACQNSVDPDSTSMISSTSEGSLNESSNTFVIPAPLGSSNIKRPKLYDSWEDSS